MLWKTNQDYSTSNGSNPLKNTARTKPLQPTYKCQVQSFCTSFYFFCCSLSKPADAMHKVKVHELPAVVPQPQPVREMCHVVEHGGGHAAQVQEVHRAGTQIQQHHRVDGCTLHCDVMSWSGRRCLPHVHGSVRGLCVCSHQHPSLPKQLDQESVNSCSGLCPSTLAYQTTPSPRSSCCAWRRPGCRRKK